MFKLPNKCSSCLKIATWRCQTKHRISIRDFYTKIKPPTFPAPQLPKALKPPPPLNSPEGSIKMSAPKILMESDDLTCINKTLKKFTDGELARKKWSTNINGELLSVNEFNDSCGNVFENAASIKLDDSTRRQTVIQSIPVHKKIWDEEREKIYIFAKNDKIVKIGGTRCSMKERFNSYLCGHHVNERGKNQTCSITNARLYHSIEKDLLETVSVWKVYTWTLPVVKHTINILGTETTVISQTYHAYESCCIKKYKEITGHIPLMCDNCDPIYIKKTKNKKKNKN